MHTSRILSFASWLLLCSLTVGACTNRDDGTQAATLPASPVPTVTPFQPASPTPELVPQDIPLWLSPAVPGALRPFVSALSEVSDGRIRLVDDSVQALVRLEPQPGAGLTTWVFAVVAPFPTLEDGISLAGLRSLWAGGGQLYMAPATAAAMESLLGPPAPGVVVPVPPATLLDTAWTNRPAMAIVPFEALEPRWKVLEVDAMSPVRRDFRVDAYPLAISFGLSGDPAAVRYVQGLVTAGQGAAAQWPESDRDPSKMTLLVMTGVTALVRGTAARMDDVGVDYPGELIGDWLRDADLTHISNEVAFASDCPPQDPYSTSMRFCSDPSYLTLLEHVGVDLVELTGNHVLDWGVDAFSRTLDMYDQEGWLHFGGGRDLEDSLQPALVEHNGNRLAFLGCNPAGPPSDWAGESSPGSTPCDYDRLYAELARLRGEGYLPIFTFQWAESYRSQPLPEQVAGFRRAVDAGAIIVSGSQAHQPQGFEFYGGGFIHYGPGNLFFDQMWSQPTRQEFIDRYVFYDGRLISMELLTAFLEDWAQPRPMTPEERTAFLEEIFTASGW
jgi:hypothetical protein